MKTITSHDIPTITIIMILLSMGVGTRLNDAQSNGKPLPNKTNMTNKTQPSKSLNDARRIIGLALLKESKIRAWWLTSNGLK